MSLAAIENILLPLFNKLANKKNAPPNLISAVFLLRDYKNKELKDTEKQELIKTLINCKEELQNLNLFDEQQTTIFSALINEIGSEEQWVKIVTNKININGNIFLRHDLSFRVDSEIHLSELFQKGLFGGGIFGECVYKLDIANELKVNSKTSKGRQILLQDTLETVIDTHGRWSAYTHSQISIALRNYCKVHGNSDTSIIDFCNYLLDIVLNYNPTKHDAFIKSVALQHRDGDAPILNLEEKSELSSLANNKQKIYSYYKKIIYMTANAFERSKWMDKKNKGMFNYNIMIIINPNIIEPSIRTWGEVEIKNVTTDILGIVSIIDNKVFTNEIVNLMLRLTESCPDRRLPIYDCYGNLVWPKKI